jgi:Secretion system C-terminal sorting domain
MNNLTTTMKQRLLKAFAVLGLITGLHTTGTACNNSSFTLVSNVVTAGPTYTITTQLCIGYGRTGVVFGADAPTNGFFSIGVWSTNLGIMGALQSWAPYYLANGTALNPPPLMPPGPVAFNSDPMNGNGQIGPGFGAGEADNIFFADPVCACFDYTCIISTVNCGNAGSLCQNLTFVYFGIRPDSLRALGIEGLAPFGGCWPNPDMLINLSTLPVVWGEFTGTSSNGGVNLTWNTHQERNAKKFVVNRAKGYSEEFNEVGTLDAAGNSSVAKTYSFFDPNPSPGVNAYNLHQIGEDGNVEQSQTIYVTYTAPTAVSVEKYFPNPVTDKLNVLLNSDQEMPATLTLVNIEGKVASTKTVTLLIGANEESLVMTDLLPGIYFLRISTFEGTIEKKILKF